MCVFFFCHSCTYHHLFDRGPPFGPDSMHFVTRKKPCLSFMRTVKLDVTFLNFVIAVEFLASDLLLLFFDQCLYIRQQRKFVDSLDLESVCTHATRQI